MIYVYCRRGSDGARALANELEGQRLRNFDGMRFWRKNKQVTFQPGDVIICWGDALPDNIGEGVRVLNGVETPNKYDTAMKFASEGIPTVNVYKDRHYDDVRYRQMLDSGYLPRMNNHVGGNDLLNPVRNPDYWVSKVAISEEYRIHSFNGKSIRAGKKVLREGFTISDENVAASEDTLKRASDWIRSYDGGWKISYDNFKSNSQMREIAHKAVASLGLTFGAVDIAKTSSGFIVLEVNRAPGLEGNTIKAYAAVIKEWINNDAGTVQGGNEVVGEVPDPFAQGDEQQQPVADNPAQPNYGYIEPAVQAELAWNLGANQQQPILRQWAWIGFAEPAGTVPAEAGIPERPVAGAAGAPQEANGAAERAVQPNAPAPQRNQIRPRVGGNPTRNWGQWLREFNASQQRILANRRR